MTTDRGPARYVSPATGGAVCHSTMSCGDGSDVSIHRRHGPARAGGNSNSSGSQ